MKFYGVGLLGLMMGGFISGNLWAETQVAEPSVSAEATAPAVAAAPAQTEAPGLNQQLMGFWQDVTSKTQAVTQSMFQSVEQAADDAGQAVAESAEQAGQALQDIQEETEKRAAELQAGLNWESWWSETREAATESWNGMLNLVGQQWEAINPWAANPAAPVESVAPQTSPAATEATSSSLPETGTPLQVAGK